jgi:UDP-N-acetylglucosamine--N-acetylmuramyl-(pentapeptide) pyrophosphoryl-undecaprenol N-acetylglucosamine transferase
MARLVGWAWGARIAILEQNAVPGLTNRILARFAHRVLSAFPGIEHQFPRGKVEVSGNPVRAEMRPLPSAPRDPFTIFVFGGSQGAQGINSLVLDAIPLLGDLKGRLRFIHQTGERDFERVRDSHARLGTQAQVERFIYDMAGAYAQASLLVCRAGSSTLAEVAAVRRASVLVPFPFAADNHQEKNARIFEQGGAARVLVQARSEGKDLAAIIRECIENPARVDAMERAAAAFYRPNAAKDVVGSLLR